MSRATQLTLLFLGALTLVAAAGGLAQADNPQQLQAALTGPAIRGAAPVGEARVDQDRQPGRLEVRVRNVKLPDGTALNVSIRGIDVGRMVLSRGEARLRTTIPFRVTRNTDVLTVRAGAATVVSGTFMRR